MQRILFCLMLSSLFLAQDALAQKYSSFQADFSMMEKNTLKDSSYLVLGKIEYDLYSNEAIYKVHFPEKKTWILKDTTMTVLDESQTIERIDTLASVNEFSIFAQILNDDLQDFGLMNAGFTLAESEKIKEGIYLKFEAPPQTEFVKEVILKKEDGLLKGIIFVDENDKQFSKVFYQEYINVKDINVPTKIKTHLTGQEKQIFKELQFRNIVIE